jgi:hypothetical protein
MCLKLKLNEFCEPLEDINCNIRTYAGEAEKPGFSNNALRYHERRYRKSQVSFWILKVLIKVHSLLQLDF